MKYAGKVMAVLLAAACLLVPLPVRAENDNVLADYEEYKSRLAAIEKTGDIGGCGFTVVEDQIFPIEVKGYGEISMIPAFDEQHGRLALFFAQEDGTVIYRTDQLETNNRFPGQMKQPGRSIAAIVFEDLNRDGYMDIVLLTTCVNDGGPYAGKPYRVGDVLFQSGQQTGFYQDYRISDQINRFGMNKNTELIIAFVRDGHSTEFLYTASTLDELLAQGLEIIPEQYYTRTFGKLGRLKVVPGIYHIASFDIFMVYVANEQGNIIASLQPMGNYDNLYALKGINCQDIDGDGLKDIVILAKYSYETDEGEMLVETDYSIYYQRTGAFSADTEIKAKYRCNDDDTMEKLVEKARAYWGWKVEKTEDD
ncbi:VCBS repeat-containing protein [Lachnospiraceae bacterium JLR.KK008]